MSFWGFIIVLMINVMFYVLFDLFKESFYVYYIYEEVKLVLMNILKLKL